MPPYDLLLTSFKAKTMNGPFQVPLPLLSTLINSTVSACSYFLFHQISILSSLGPGKQIKLLGWLFIPQYFSLKRILVQFFKCLILDFFKKRKKFNYIIVLIDETNVEFYCREKK